MKTAGLLKNVLALALLIGLVMSHRLWLSERQYPLIPLFDWLPAISAPWDQILFAGLLVLIVLILMIRNPKFLICVFLGICTLLAVLDQSRWQPWFYQYLFMMAALAYFYFHREFPVKMHSALNTCRIVLCGIYLWAGIHKMNYSFINEVVPWLIEPLLPFSTHNIVVKIAALFVPFIEISIPIRA